MIFLVYVIIFFFLKTFCMSINQIVMFVISHIYQHLREAETLAHLVQTYVINGGKRNCPDNSIPSKFNVFPLWRNSWFLDFMGAEASAIQTATLWASGPRGLLLPKIKPEDVLLCKIFQKGSLLAKINLEMLSTKDCANMTWQMSWDFRC